MILVDHRRGGGAGVVDDDVDPVAANARGLAAARHRHRLARLLALPGLALAHEIGGVLDHVGANVVEIEKNLRQVGVVFDQRHWHVSPRSNRQVVTEANRGMRIVR